MPRATYNGAVISESDDTVVVEVNHCFPPESVNRQYLAQNSSHTTCP